MRLDDKHSIATMDKDIFYINFDHFMKLEGNYNTIEIAEEFGISPHEIIMLKKKMSGT